tara:strand:- start:5114 stop:6286 length:1173 start_codon:yes stop_codon:yes gene_type:complete
MNKDIIILGSTGSIGTSTLKSIRKKKNFKIILLTTNKNIKKIFNQAINYRVKNVIVEDEVAFNKYKIKFKKKKINLYLGIKYISKIIKKKTTFCVNAISGINGLDPTLKAIPLTKNILIANKESIICGWELISKKLKKYNTNFIPIDSEHFSIWKLIKNEKIETIDKIILTASGGPFLNKSKKKISNIKPSIATKHPNWSMGKKISIDSSTMMNKVFEFIEAKKIFNLKKDKLTILIQPSSYIHAIVYLNGEIIKLLAHEPNMIIPISNALGIKNKKISKITNGNIKKFNNLNFSIPKVNNFPLLKILNLIPENETYFEIILTTLNDNLVNKYLNDRINYISIQKNLLYFIKCKFFKKFYKVKPFNINDVKKMIKITNNYLNKNIKLYEK